MPEDQAATERIEAFRSIIDRFLQARLQNRLESNASRSAELSHKFKPENWIPDAAKRAGQIALVTHAVKYQNPDARGSCIYDDAEKSEAIDYVSTRSLRHRKDDVVGNAAALDVYKFLELELEGEAFLARILRQDPDLKAAFPGDQNEKDALFRSFAAIADSPERPASHTLAKQVYFPVAEVGYHLLAPLFPTSLVHAVYGAVQTRFDEKVKLARKARKEKKPHPHGYREYFDTAIQRFGGTKPQNISQLNSERRGQAYLLPSLPPAWQSDPVRPPLRSTSVFTRIFSRHVRNHTDAFREFLTSVELRGSNVRIRQKRKDYLSTIVDALLFFAAQIQELPPGWTSSPECRLVKHQAVWLDPHRENEDWQRERRTADWPQRVASDFAAWLNATLQTPTLRFGDAEFLEWKHEILRELEWLREEDAR